MPPTDSEDRRPTALLALLIVLCLACDFLMVPIVSMVPGPPRTPGFALALTIVGSVLAQGCLLAAWLAWSDQPFWQRFTRHWIVATILYLVWTAGFALSQVSQFAQFSSIVGLSVPLVSIAAQTPLWIARQTFGWRLLRDDERITSRQEKNAAGPDPLSIRDLLMATMLVALSLALARLAPSVDNGDRGVVWLMMFAIASIISALTLLPTAPLLLRMQSFQHGMLFAGLYAAFWAGLPWLVVIVARHYGLFPPPPIAFLVGVSSLILSFAATVILAATAARARGYSLVYGRRPRRSGGFGASSA